MKRLFSTVAVPLTLGLGLVLLVSACAADNPEESAPEEAAPLNVLMITGGGWHDYDAQKNILEKGISERANVTFTIDHTAGESSDGDIERHEDTAWAEEFDLVLYNMCFVEMRDVEWSQRIVNAHVEHGVPAVALHCGVASYNFYRDDDMWYRFMGVRTHEHQSHMPYTVELLEPDHPILAGFPDEWETPHGELYNIEEVFNTSTPLAHSYGEDTGEYHINVWTNEYDGVRVFGTTIGHHNETMEHENYLNLVTNGLLWAADRLDEQGQPQAEYGRTASDQ